MLYTGASCNRCGVCISSCPVHEVTGLEAHGPRGKMALIEANREGSLPQSARFEELLSYCLLCGSCSSNCAAGIDVPGRVQKARAEIVNRKGLGAGRQFFFEHVLDSGSVLPLILKGCSLLQGIYSKVIAEDSGLHLRFPLSFFSKRRWIPSLAQTFFLDESSYQGNRTSARLAYFSGCVTNYLFPDTGKAVVNILNFFGEGVFVPRNQRCCGFSAFSAGDNDTARSLAKANVLAFAESRFERIISSCASCSHHMRLNYPRLLEGDPVLAPEAVEFSKKVEDISSFLSREEKCYKCLSRLSVGRRNRLRVAYHNPCHLRIGQRIAEVPRALLKLMPNVDLSEFKGQSDCCGYGGLFNLSHYDISREILDKKIFSLKKTSSDIITTSCMGCLLHWKESATRHHLGMGVMHLAELIDFSLQNHSGE